MWENSLWEQSLLAIAFVQSTEMLHVTISSRASFAPTGLLSPSMFWGLLLKSATTLASIFTL
ncbi:hypothetical protein CVG87_29535 [Pseudomonas sp. WCS365]|nr:hypothetical protein CVG87_29535 [Pseudomonas sp. WCS365]QEO81001.1 hypothetical protein ELZ14_26955 [Pseudomonas brassicacearum]